ncbi:MAG: transposase [Fuerstiella sp.]|nr:transposase [Fuerstiella sp.]MCP4784697.1 transposase [Fuerstiella sp.]
MTAQTSLPALDHLQEDIINNVYRVVCYRHEAAFCDDCGRSVQKPGKGQILGSRIGPYLRSLAVWLRNAIGISYRKIPRIVEEMYGITFTPAALIGFETMLAEKAEPVIDDIQKKLASSFGAVHADETYWTTDGARSYFIAIRISCSSSTTHRVPARFHATSWVTTSSAHW